MHIYCSPLPFFPGGDIGRLAVCGTVNDVAMMGAQPRYLTATFILEEGSQLRLLEKCCLMQVACAEAGASIIAVSIPKLRKKANQMDFISTTGFGWLVEGRKTLATKPTRGCCANLPPIGNHGIAVMQARGNLGFQSEVRSIPPR